MTNLDKLDIVIRHAGGKVIAGIPQIALYATAESAAAALDGLERKKNALKDDIAAAGIADVLPDVAGASTATSADGVGRFAIKSAIVAVMILLVLAVSGALLVNRIEAAGRAIAGTDLRGGRQFWTNLEQSLERMAEPSNEMSEERRQKILSNIRVVVNRYRPFAAEIALLFSPPPASR
jgi:phage-related tail protein